MRLETPASWVSTGVFLTPPDTLTLEEVAAMVARSSRRTTAQLAAYLDDILFPCSRIEILRCAEDNEAPDVMLDAIEDLPERRYWSVMEIISSFAPQAS